MNDNYAKVQNNKWASDDDASDLLAGILDETEDDAIAEQARLDAELNARKEEERLALASAEESRKKEAAEKLSAEMNRLEGVKQKRTEKLQAIEVEELKARGEWIDPEIERQKLEAARAAEAEAARVAAVHSAAAAAAANPVPTARAGAQPAQAKSKLPLIVLGLFALVVGIGGVLAATMLGGYSADNTSYAKAVFVPKSPEANLVEKSFTATPRKKKAAAVAATSSKRSKSKSKSRSKSRSKSSRVATKSSSKSKSKNTGLRKPKKNKASKALEKALKNSDVYGSSPF